MKLIDKEYVAQGLCACMKGSNVIFIGPIADIPPTHTFDTIFVNPRDYRNIRRSCLRLVHSQDDNL